MGPTGPTGINPLQIASALNDLVRQGAGGPAWPLVRALSHYITGTGPAGPTWPIGPTA
jgi:hypothetical protein